MKNQRTITIALILALTISAFAACLTSVTAAEIPTYTFLTVNPNPVGVGQTAVVAFWLDKVTPNAATLFGDRWSGLMLTITKPDGTTETKGPYKLSQRLDLAPRGLADGPALRQPMVFDYPYRRRDSRTPALLRPIPTHRDEMGLDVAALSG